MPAEDFGKATERLTLVKRQEQAYSMPTSVER